MATLNFHFTPGAGYSDPYTMVAFGNTNPSIPLGQTTISGYGSTVSGSITGVASDAPYKVKIYTNVCADPVGEIDY